MFNYSKPWTKELDSELVESVINGKPMKSIAESVGKTIRQVYYRINAIKKNQLECVGEHALAEKDKRLIRVDGSFEYTKNLKLGE